MFEIKKRRGAVAKSISASFSLLNQTFFSQHDAGLIAVHGEYCGIG